MKKTLVSAILGLAAIASVQAQGNINLYNYNSTGAVANPIVYGAGSGGPLGVGVTTGGYTVGMYIVAGNQTAAINASFNGSGYDLITGMGSQVTGVGATTPLGDFDPGEYSAASEFNTGFVGQTVTVVVVAYQGANYAGATVRGHSQAFTMLTTAATENAALTGSFMNGFAVSAVPEPSTFALAGLGLAGLLIFRRRN